jgi:hypothetical protein
MRITDSSKQSLSGGRIALAVARAAKLLAKARRGDRGEYRQAAGSTGALSCGRLRLCVPEYFRH